MSRPRSRACTNSAPAVTLSFHLCCHELSTVPCAHLRRAWMAALEGPVHTQRLVMYLEACHNMADGGRLMPGGIFSQAHCSSCHDLVQLKGLSRLGGCIILLYPIQPSAWATRLMGPCRCCGSGCEAWDDISSAANHTLFLNFCEVCMPPLLCQ